MRLITDLSVLTMPLLVLPVRMADAGDVVADVEADVVVVDSPTVEVDEVADA